MQGHACESQPCLYVVVHSLGGYHTDLWVLLLINMSVVSSLECHAVINAFALVCQRMHTY